MGVYIRGMEMPSCCMFCPLSNNCGCGLTNPPVLMTSKEMLADRPDWCPLVPVPPHGRLGDLDALKVEAIERSEKCGVCVNVLDNVITAYDIETAPTIIPAEPAEEVKES